MDESFLYDPFEVELVVSQNVADSVLLYLR